jgi:quinol monooxygenase YgiN
VIVYVDTSDVREGALEELKPAMKELVDFVEANEPRIIAYNVYLSDDGTRMTVVHVHPDSESMEYHMEVAGPVFRRFVELVTLSSIHIYGDPSDTALRQSHEKARVLGRDAVVVDSLHAGFTRFEVSPDPEARSAPSHPSSRAR